MQHIVCKPVHAVVIPTVCALLPLSHCGLCQNNIF